MPVSYRTDGMKVPAGPTAGEYTLKPAYLVPAPTVDVSKEYLKSSDGTKIGTTYSISLTGQILPHIGSPYSTGAFSTKPKADGESIGEINTQSALFAKAAAIRNLFSVEGGLLEVTGWDASTAEDGTEIAATTDFSCQVRVVSINIDTNTYSGREPTAYTVVLEADSLSSDADVEFPSDSDSLTGEDDVTTYLSDFAEDWSLERDETPKITDPSVDSDRDDDYTYTLTHTLSAVGKRFYSGFDSSTGKPKLLREAWENAKISVEDRLGASKASNKPTYQSPSDLFGVDELAEKQEDRVDPHYLYSSKELLGLDIDEYTFYNHVRSASIDRSSGSYSITETWLLAKTEDDQADTDAQGNPAPGARDEDVIEDFTVEASINEDTNEVSVSGTITGLARVSPTDMSSITARKFTSATARFDVISGDTSATKSATLSALGSNTVNNLTKFNTNNHGLSVGDKITVTENNGSADTQVRTHTVIQRIDANNFVTNHVFTEGVTKGEWRLFTSAYTTASIIYQRAAEYSNIDVYPTPISQTVSRNPAEGSITYNYTFSDKGNEDVRVFTGAISESINISDEAATDVFASIQVPGRSAGSVLQKMNTINTPQRTVSIEAQFPPIKNADKSFLINPDFSGSDVSFAGYSDVGEPHEKADIILGMFKDDLASSAKAGNGPIFVTNDQENWDPWSGSYSRTITWQWQTA